MPSLQPSKIKLNRQSKTLELTFAENTYLLSAEYLRVHSPSAEVRGHGAEEKTLQFGKKDVGIERIVAAGNYALQIFFDDGHNTGIYTWDYLYDLCINEEANWQEYIAQLHHAGKTREADVQVLTLK